MWSLAHDRLEHATAGTRDGWQERLGTLPWRQLEVAFPTTLSRPRRGRHRLQPAAGCCRALHLAAAGSLQGAHRRSGASARQARVRHRLPSARQARVQPAGAGVSATSTAATTTRAPAGRVQQVWFFSSEGAFQSLPLYMNTIPHHGLSRFIDNNNYRSSILIEHIEALVSWTRIGSAQRTGCRPGASDEHTAPVVRPPR